jgi:serine phosphatase RsbU (regulator of sigma subunit)/PAS domain-containing protein
VRTEQRQGTAGIASTSSRDAVPLGRNVDFERAAARIIETLCVSLGWDVGAAWVKDDNTDTLRCTEIWTCDARLDAFVDASRSTPLRVGQGLPGRVVQSGRPEWIRDVVSDPNFPRVEAARSAGLHGAFAFPVRRNDEVIAVLEFLSSHVYDSNVRLGDMLDAIAVQIGTLIDWENIKADNEFRRALLESLSEASLDGIVAGGLDNRTLYWNKRYIEMWGIPDGLIGIGKDGEGVIEFMASRTVSPEAYMAVANAVRAEPEVARRDELNLIDGRVFDRWTAPVRTSDGTIIGRMSTYRDVTEQKQVERSLRRSEQWVSFLAGVGTLLSESLDFDTALQQFARLAVPWMGDWCVIHMIEPDGSLRPVAVGHVDETRVAQVMALQERYPPDPNADTGVAAVVRSRTPELFHEITDEMLVAGAHDEEHLATLRELSFKSAIIVPIVARERVLGAITLVSTNANRLYTDDDLKRAEELAARAAFPIDNARLFEQNLLIAQTLQRSLLPPALPQIPGVDISARYVPAGHGVDVGGDFYDAFAVGRRTWAVALGDVTGKGVEAATVTSLARHSIRTAAMTTHRPSEILGILNQALLEDPTVERFCTAVVAMIEPKFGRVRVTISCAGHPHPYIVRSGGTVEEVDIAGTLLGFMPNVPLTDAHVELQFGDKLVLYTDGVTDVRGRATGEQEFLRLLDQSAKRGTQATTDFITRAVIDQQGGQPSDDIAIVVIGVRSSIFRSSRSPRKEDDDP